MTPAAALQHFRRARSKGAPARAKLADIAAPRFGMSAKMQAGAVVGLFAGLVLGFLFDGGDWFTGGFFGAFLGFLLPLAWAILRPFVRLALWAGKATAKAAQAAPVGFCLVLGTASGKLAAQRHGSAIRGGDVVILRGEDAAQNVAIFGGIGSGKTTRAIQPLLLQLLDQDTGGLIFDVKGDFRKAVAALAAATGREVQAVGVGQRGLNLLAGLTPEVAASFLKSAFILNGSGKGDGAFWVDTATELCRNALGLLRLLDGRYSLDALYRYLYVPGVREAWRAEAEGLELSQRDRRLLSACIEYQDLIFEEYDAKVKSGTNATVAQVLSPFNHPDLIDAFCTDAPDLANLEEVLAGRVFLVDLPLSVFGMGAKVAYTFIKLRFFNVMQRRTSREDWNQTREVFFLCDEYQELVACNRDGISDLNFWDKSRSSRCMGIVSAQSVTSFYAAIGDKDTTDTLLQNFRQVLSFRTEDKNTIERLNYLLGSVERERLSFSSEMGLSVSDSGQNRAMQEAAVLNPQHFRQLGANEALAVLNIGGEARDDVLEVVPVFV